MKRRNPRCEQCNKALARYTYPGGPLLYGYAGAGHFCSLRCAWRFALVVVKYLPAPERDESRVTGLHSQAEAYELGRADERRARRAGGSR